MLYFCSVGGDDKIGELAVYIYIYMLYSCSTVVVGDVYIYRRASSSGSCIYIYMLYFCSVGGDDKIGAQ